MDVMHEAGHYIKIKYDWINVDGSTVTFSQTDTGFMKDWTLVQIEGEERVPTDQEVDQKASAKAVGGGAKKPADAKKGAGSKAGQLEEITDNRPREITYTRDIGEEMGGVGLEITKDIAIAFSKAFMNVEIYDVNRETQEEVLSETIKLDLSCLLYPKDSLNVSQSVSL
jgi:hypothetical protein